MPTDLRGRSSTAGPHEDASPDRWAWRWFVPTCFAGTVLFSLSVTQAPLYSGNRVPSIGVSNLIQIVETPRAWIGDLLVSSLKLQSLYRIRIREGRVIFAEPIDIGERIRDLEQMQDGTILLWADNARLVELTAVDASLVE